MKKKANDIKDKLKSSKDYDGDIKKLIKSKELSKS